MSEVYTNLYLRRQDAARPEVKAILDRAEFDDTLIKDDEPLAFFGRNDCEGANLEIESDLENLQVPYDKSWDSDAGFPAGERKVRFGADGACSVFETNDEKRSRDFERLLGVMYESGTQAAVNWLEDWAANHPRPVSLKDLP